MGSASSLAVAQFDSLSVVVVVGFGGKCQRWPPKCLELAITVMRVNVRCETMGKKSDGQRNVISEFPIETDGKQTTDRSTNSRLPFDWIILLDSYTSAGS